MAIPDPTQSYLQGFQIGANVVGQRMDREQRMQELRSLEAARQAQERNIAQTMAMKLEERNQAIQYSADMSKAVGQFEAMAVPFIPVPGVGNVPNPIAMPQEEAFKRTVLKVVAQHQPEKVGPLLLEMDLNKIRAETLKQRADFDSTSDPEIKTIADPNNPGKTVTVYRSGPNSWSRVPERLAEPRATTVIDPNTKNPITYVQQGPNSFGRVPLSTGQQQLEQTEIASGNIFQKGRELLPLINDRTTSVTSNLKRIVRDKGLEVFLPESFSPSAEVTEADATAREFMAGIVRGLRSDGNINETEAQALFNEANTVRWVNERTGKSRVRAFVKGAVSKARDASLRLGRPINEKYLTFQEIGKRAEAKAEAGEMTKEQAMDWALSAYSNSAEVLIRDIDQQIGK